MATRADRRGQWLLILAVAAGLIAMHHVLVACSNTMSSSTVAGGTHADMTRTAAHHDELSVQTSAMSDATPKDCGAMLGHLCMAVLGAASALLVVLLLALFVVASAPRLVIAAGVVPVSARAPPIARARLVRLCVWRC